MIYLLIGLVGMMVYKGKNSISFVLFSLMLVSAVSAFAVGKQHTYDVSVLAYTIFNSILLIILFNSFNKYSNVKSYDMSNINITKLYLVEKVTIALGIIALIISFYVFWRLNLMVSAEIMTVEEYRYGGAVTEMLNKIVGNHLLITITYLFSPIGYISLFFHFHYLTRRMIKKAIVHLVISFTIFTPNMMALSRAALVTYAFEYGIMLYFYYPLIDANIRQKMNIVISLTALIAALYFMTITTNRFEDRASFYYVKSNNKPIINPVTYNKLYSVCDYAGQWQEYGPRALEKYNPDFRFWGLYNCSGLMVYIANYVNPKFSQEMDDQLRRILGQDRVLFHGVIARLVFDFGFVGAIVFICFFAYLVKKVAPENGTVAGIKAILYPVILPFPASFFCGNIFCYMTLDIAVIYTIVIIFYLRKKK
ncbi:MAG: hypothetical protein IKP73_13435 [Bacteroidales bacterium]|nr:hypothetical protein [Bacteroidales bacterium]